jgi:hypothetical protein
MQALLGFFRKLDLHTAAKKFSKVPNIGEPWKMSEIDGDEEADFDEYVLWLLSWDLSKQPQPSLAFIKAFGNELGPLLENMSRHYAHLQNMSQPNYDDDDEIDDASVGSPADDMSTSLTSKLSRALEDARKVMKIARTKATAEIDARKNSSSLKAGAKVMLINLRSRPELNGLSATVLSRCKPPDSGSLYEERWVVQLESREQLAAKKENMIVTAAAPSSARKQGREATRHVQAVRQAAVTARSILDPVLRECIEPHYCKAVRRLLREAYVFRGNLEVINSMNNPECSPAECQLVQMDAALAAFHSKRQIPDAFYLRGASQYLRGNMAEAVQEMSASLLWPECKWVWQPGRQFAEELLVKARMGSVPLCGAWEELAWEPGRAPCQRVGAASCTVGHLLYLFGGLRPRASDAAALRVLTRVLREAEGEAAPSQRPLGDLWTYDARSRAWEEVGGAGPPARAFGLLAHDAAGGALYLYGGRQTWEAYGAGEPMADLWCFELAARRWRQLPGPHPGGIHLGPAAVHGGGLLVVDPHAPAGGGKAPGRALALSRYDLATGRWRRRWCGGGGPALAAPVAGWAQDSRLFTFSEERREAGAPMRCVVWSVGLEEGGAWAPHVLSGPALAGGSEGRRFAGAAPVPWTEGAASFDPVTRKAYLFGGWTEVYIYIYVYIC